MSNVLTLRAMAGISVPSRRGTPTLPPLIPFWLLAGGGGRNAVGRLNAAASLPTSIMRNAIKLVNELAFSIQTHEPDSEQERMCFSH